MKLNQLLSETEINEFDVPIIGKRAKAQRVSNKSAKRSMSDELMNMEVELKTFMRTANIKTATPEVVLNYLKQKGLNKAGQDTINNFVTTSQKIQNVAGAAGQVVGKGLAKASAIKQGAKNIAAKLKPQQTQPQDTDPQATPTNQNEPETTPIDPLDRASKYTPRFNEQISMDTSLTKNQVRSILQQTLQKGYAQSAGFGKSKFASDEPGSPGEASPEVKTAIDTLQKAGFKVSK